MSAVPKLKVFDVSGGQALTETLRIDMTNTSKADIRSMIISIAARETATQNQLGNPPSITEVDGNKSKPVSQVNKKVIILFGVQLKVDALQKVTQLLMTNIRASTNVVTGNLSDPGNWEWRLIRNGRPAPIIGDTVNFGPRDFLVLRPKLAYASAVNKRVASGSNSLEYRASNARKGKTAKRNQKLGFMAKTARDARGVSDLVPFSVSVGMTSKYAVPGELRKIGGTAYLLIAPRRRSYRG